MKDSRCQNSPPPSSSHFFYISNIISCQANKQTVTGRRCQSNLPQRPFVGNRVMPLFTAGIVSSAIRDPRCRQLLWGWMRGRQVWKNTTEYHYIKTWWIFFGGVLDGEEGIWNWVLAHVSCQDACHVFLWFYRHIHCISETLVRVWHLLLAEIRSPTDSDRFWLAIWQICQPVWESLLDCFVYCLLKYPYIWIVVM